MISNDFILDINFFFQDFINEKQNSSSKWQKQIPLRYTIAFRRKKAALNFPIFDT